MLVVFRSGRVQTIRFLQGITQLPKWIRQPERTDMSHEGFTRLFLYSNSRKSTYLVDCIVTFREEKTKGLDLQVPRNTTHLILSHNCFETISNGSFGQLQYLIYLDLCCNRLRRIESDAFVGLHNLVFLDLHRNYLHEAAVFLRPLTSLTILNIWHQDLTLTGAADYPLDCILNGILDLEHCLC